MRVSNQDVVKTDTTEKSRTSLSSSERIWTFELDFNGSRTLLFVLFSSVSAASNNSNQGQL